MPLQVQTSISAVILSALALVAGADAAAATVVNPGPVTLTSTGGSAVFGQLSRADAFAPPSTFTASGSVDSFGHMSFPSAQISWPVTLGGTQSSTDPMITAATITLKHVGVIDSVGLLDPATGAALLGLNLEPTEYVWSGTVTGVSYNGDCVVGTQGPVEPITLQLTTGQTHGSPPTSGTPYDQNSGALSVVDNAWSLPALSIPRDSCQFTGPAALFATAATFVQAFNSEVSGPGEFRINAALDPTPRSTQAAQQTPAGQIPSNPPSGGSTTPSPSPSPIAAKLAQRWRVKGAQTKLLKLLVSGLPGNARVTASCSGKRCAFRSRVVPVVGGAANVAGSLEGKARVFRAGQRLTLAITAPGAIGEAFVTTMRRARKPATKALCLPRGATVAATC